MLKTQLHDLIDWDLVLSQSRYAGGHEDVMMNIFGARAQVVAAWVESDYSGVEAFAYRFADNSVVIITDYFGSCSGCDSWEDSSDEDARQMIDSLVGSARLFDSARAAREWCESGMDAAEDYPFRAAVNLVESLKKH